MDERARVAAAANALADAISRRDRAAVLSRLTRDFLLRTPDGPSTDADTFARAIEGIAAEIVFVRLNDLKIDLRDGVALVTGVQHAQCRVDGQIVDERRPFVDWFVRDDAGNWLVKVAVDLPPLQ
jgi:ketosteroid isomerase-like protein